MLLIRLLPEVDYPAAKLSQRTDKKVNAEEEEERREKCDGFSCFTQEAFSKQCYFKYCLVEL